MIEPGHQLIVHFMRHAEALHKLSDVTDITIRDPDLSPKGLDQCLDFAKAFEDQERYITHILSSPMTRALNTACIAFRPIIESRLTVIALPQLQSLDEGPNGIGLDYDQLGKRYDGTHWDQFMMGKPDGWVDATSFVPVGWNVKERGKWSNEEFKWRMEDFKGFLKGIWVGAGAGRKRVEVAVVTHGSFLRQLVNDVKFKDVEITSCILDTEGNLREISTEELEKDRALEEEASDAEEEEKRRKRMLRLRRMRC